MDGFVETMKGICWIAAFFLLGLFFYLTFSANLIRDCETVGATIVNGKVIECKVLVEQKGES